MAQIRFRPTIIQGLVAVGLAFTVAVLALKIGVWAWDDARVDRAKARLDAGPVKLTPEEAAEHHRQAGAAPERFEPAPVLPKASVARTVRGHDLGYTLELPGDWTTRKGGEGLEEYDTVCVCKSMYVGIIAEEAQIGSTEKVALFARDHLKKDATDLDCGEPDSILLDGRKWVKFVAKCRVEGVPVGYQFYVYSGPEGTFQIIGWTVQNLFDRDADALRAVMGTFRFPVQLASSAKEKRILLPSGASIVFSKPLQLQECASFQSSLLQELDRRGLPPGRMVYLDDNVYRVSHLLHGYGSSKEAYSKYFDPEIQPARAVALKNGIWARADLQDGYNDAVTGKKVVTELADCCFYSDDKQTVVILGVLDSKTKLGWQRPKARTDYSQNERVKDLLAAVDLQKMVEEFAAGFEPP